MATVGTTVVDRGLRDHPRSRSHVLGRVVPVLGLIGLVDLLTGTEVRAYPLYFAPVALASALGGLRAGLTTAAAAIATWLGTNHLGGLRYSHDGIAVLNVLTQLAGLVVIAELVARQGRLLRRERERARSTSGRPSSSPASAAAGDR